MSSRTLICVKSRDKKKQTNIAAKKEMIFLDLWSLSPTSQLPSNTVLFHKKKVEFPNKFDWQEIENQIDLSTNRKLVYPQIGRDLISHRNPMEDSGQKQDQDWTSVFTQQVKKPIKVDDHGSLCLQVFLIWLKKKQISSPEMLVNSSWASVTVKFFSWSTK